MQADGNLIFLSGVPFKLPLVKTTKGDVTHNPNIPAAQQGMANASYVPTPVERENFRPREPVHMQQHALSIGNSVHTEAQIDIGLTAADVQFHTLCKELLISGDCWLLEIFLVTFCFKTICYPTFLMDCMDCFYWGVLSSGFCWLVRCGNCSSRLRTFLVSATMLQISIMQNSTRNF